MFIEKPLSSGFFVRRMVRIKKTLTHQIPVNKGWQGFLFAEYKTTPLEFKQNLLLISTGNFLLLREGNNLEPSSC